MTTENTVLIVDDEEDIRRLLERAFSKKGFIVLSSNNALDGLVQLQDNPVNVIITDIRMPGMDGLDFIAQAQEIASKVPIIVISGYGSFETAREAFNRGAFYFINKPFNMQAIEDVVQKALRLPGISTGSGKIVSFARHVLEFNVPPDMEMVDGINYQLSRVARDMGYNSKCYNVKAPFVLDELLVMDINSVNGTGRKQIDVRVEVTSERIVIEIKSDAAAFKKEKYPPSLEEIDYAAEETLSLMMVRHFADELTFSDDCLGARAVLYKNRDAPKEEPLS